MLPSTLLQKKTFTKWVNSKLATSDTPDQRIHDLHTDLCDGHRLLTLVRVLVKKKVSNTALIPEKQNLRIHHIINVGKALKCIEQCTNMPLPNIGSEDIVDGNLKLTLGLIWLLILRFQIVQIPDLEHPLKLQNGKSEMEFSLKPSSSTTFEVMVGSKEESKTLPNTKHNVESTSTKAGGFLSPKKLDAQAQLLQWTQNRLSKILPNVPLPSNFNKAWQDGQHFCLLVHGYAPTHLHLSQVRPLNDNTSDWKHNLDLAFNVAEDHLHIPKLLDSEDMVAYADEKSIMTYLSGFCELPIPEPAPPPSQSEIKSIEPQLLVTTHPPDNLITQSTKPVSPLLDSGAEVSTTSSTALPPKIPTTPTTNEPISPPKRNSLFPLNISSALSTPIAPISALTSYAASFVLPKSPITPTSPSSSTISAATSSISKQESLQPNPPSSTDLPSSPDLEYVSKKPLPSSPSDSLPSHRPSLAESLVSYVSKFVTSRQSSIAEVSEPFSSNPPEMMKDMLKEPLNSSLSNSLSFLPGHFSPPLHDNSPSSPISYTSSQHKNIEISEKPMENVQVAESEIKVSDELTKTSAKPGVIENSTSNKYSISKEFEQPQATTTNTTHADMEFMENEKTSSPVHEKHIQELKTTCIELDTTASINLKNTEKVRVTLTQEGSNSQVPRAPSEKKEEEAEEHASPSKTNETELLKTMDVQVKEKKSEEDMVNSQQKMLLEAPLITLPNGESMVESEKDKGVHFTLVKELTFTEEGPLENSQKKHKVKSIESACENLKQEILDNKFLLEHSIGKVSTSPIAHPSDPPHTSSLKEAQSNDQDLAFEKEKKEERYPTVALAQDTFVLSQNQTHLKAAPQFYSVTSSAIKGLKQNEPLENQLLSNETNNSNALGMNSKVVIDQTTLPSPTSVQVVEKGIAEKVTNQLQSETAETKERTMVCEEKENNPSDPASVPVSQNLGVQSDKNSENLPSLSSSNLKFQTIQPTPFKLENISKSDTSFPPKKRNSILLSTTNPTTSASSSQVSFSLTDSIDNPKSKSKNRVSISNSKPQFTDQQFVSFKNMEFRVPSDLQFEELSQDVPNDKILIMALNYLSKQLELLPSNPASYQVRVELYQLYESQFQGLLARAIELQLIPPTLIENTIWIEKPSDMLGALFFDVQEQLKKEGKLLTYERHIHMIIGLALVIFMTWAFFYLPILNLDADDL